MVKNKQAKRYGQVNVISECHQGLYHQFRPGNRGNRATFPAPIARWEKCRVIGLWTRAWRLMTLRRELLRMFRTRFTAQ